MNTPIYDFVSGYSREGFVRFHMPGHKGKGFLGCEALDITEVMGADVLYSCKGIIRESEDNLSSLFGTAHSFYSTEGSTLCIKAMLALAAKGKDKPLVLAARNVHKAFCYAAALLDLEVEFIYSASRHLCSCEISPEDVRKAMEGCERKPSAVYITSPDYLGYIPDIEGIASVCREHDIPLLVDNAHGAYLKFLPGIRHPIDLGATLCCDSAHKTLPVLTGGAYLHISKDASEDYIDSARNMLSLFASTSPSYLILQSLDLCNKHLYAEFRDKLDLTVKRVEGCKSALAEMGYHIRASEPLKIVIEIKNADKLAAYLHGRRIESEFADAVTLVLMVSSENSEADFSRLTEALSDYNGDRSKDRETDISFTAKRVMSIRRAMLSECEDIPVKDAVGRICAAPTVSCPPAIPIAVSGEEITGEALALFGTYGIEYVSVIKQ